MQSYDRIHKSHLQMQLPKTTAFVYYSELGVWVLGFMNAVLVNTAFINHYLQMRSFTKTAFVNTEFPFTNAVIY